MTPEHLLSSALQTATDLLDQLERPAAGRPSLHPAGRAARSDVWDGCEIARRAAHIAGPYGDVREVRGLLEELLACDPPGLAVGDGLRAEAWALGCDLAARGLEALEGLVHGSSVGPTAAPGEVP